MLVWVENGVAKYAPVYVQELSSTVSVTFSLTNPQEELE